MQKTTQICLTIALLAIANGQGQNGHTKKMDVKVMPDEVRTFCSPSKKCVLTIRTLDHWRTPRPQATLTVEGSEVWESAIQNWHGPKTACVTNKGNVVLFDEWPNIKSELAVTLISDKGKSKKVWTFDQIRSIAKASSDDITAFAKIGNWLGGLPAVKGETVSFAMAKVRMSLSIPNKSIAVGK